MGKVIGFLEFDCFDCSYDLVENWVKIWFEFVVFLFME